VPASGDGYRNGYTFGLVEVVDSDPDHMATSDRIDDLTMRLATIGLDVPRLITIATALQKVARDLALLDITAADNRRAVDEFLAHNLMFPRKGDIPGARSEPIDELVQLFHRYVNAWLDYYETIAVR
jgi:hypothetical protein